MTDMELKQAIETCGATLSLLNRAGEALDEAAILIATIGTTSSEHPSTIHRAVEWLKRNGYENRT